MKKGRRGEREKESKKEGRQRGRDLYKAYLYLLLQISTPHYDLFGYACP